MSPHPVVSILVPYVRTRWIDECLQSIHSCAPSLPYEVLVLANGEEAMSQPPAYAFAELVRLESRVNLGFSGGINWLAAHARGDAFVLMNDDTQVTSGWLDVVLAALHRDELTAAAGSTLLTLDGRVEESGRVLWRDGVSSPITIGHVLNDPTTPAVREVDVCSACGLVVRRSAWEVVGGLDERYYPAYYEDTDLALELRRRGWRVVCATGSRVRHRGSASTSPLWRRFIGLRNHELFVAKWRQELELFDPRPRDRPRPDEVARSLRGVAARSRRIYHEQPMEGSSAETSRGLPALDTDLDAPELLRQELQYARAELKLKDEYIAVLHKDLPSLERASARQLDAERRAIRRREFVRRIPGVGPALAAARRAARRSARS